MSQKNMERSVAPSKICIHVNEHVLAKVDVDVGVVVLVLVDVVGFFIVR